MSRTAASKPALQRDVRSPPAVAAAAQRRDRLFLGQGLVKRLGNALAGLWGEECSSGRSLVLVAVGAELGAGGTWVVQARSLR